MAIFVHLFWFSFLYESKLPRSSLLLLSLRNSPESSQNYEDEVATKQEDENEDVDEEEEEAATDAC